MDKEDLEQLQKAVRSSGEKIEKSTIFLSIFSENYDREPQTILQFGLAILMDKPIFLVVPNGVKVPKNVERLAIGIEYFDYDDKASLEAATARIIEKARSSHILENRVQE